MYHMENSPSDYYTIMHHYQEAQLLFSALRLNIFSCLDTPTTAEAVAKVLECDERKTQLLLLSLVSCGFLGRQGEFYCNLPKTKDFLSKNSEVFLGESLLFREKMSSLECVEEKLRGIAAPQKRTYDFETLAKVSIPEMYAGRVQSFLERMQVLYPDDSRPLRILDLGGGTGILAIEFVKHFPNSRAVVFDTPAVTPVTQEIICEHQAESKVTVISGDFNRDSLEGPYDFIIASGILNFVSGDLSDFIKKMADALNYGGYLFVVGQFADHDYDAPPNMVSWLSGFLDGIPLPPNQREMEGAIQKAGLCASGVVTDSMFEGQLYQKTNLEASVFSDDVIRSFIELTEKIANSRTNVLHFGGEDMTFYRGEIHMIKMIGDFPGIHSAELARKFGITRAVVHKTLQKLTDRGVITKEDDSADKKRFRLYLTEEGQTAYRCHEKYHSENDGALFDFLANMSGNQLAAIKGFLECAIGLIENHA